MSQEGIMFINRPYVPERDLYRLIKYGTYDIVSLHCMMPNTVPKSELSEEEYKLIDEFYKCEIESFMFDDLPEIKN